MEARPLELYLGQDNLIWAYDSLADVAYRMPPSDQRNQHPPAPPSNGGGGLPDAPSDGQLYGRLDSAWAVVPSAPAGDFIAAAGTTPIDWRNPPLLMSTQGNAPFAGTVLNGRQVQLLADPSNSAGTAALTVSPTSIAFNIPGWGAGTIAPDAVNGRMTYQGLAFIFTGSPIGIEGDQFDDGLNPGTSVPAIQIESSANSPGLKISQFGGLEVTGTRGELVARGAGFTCYSPSGGRVAIGNDADCITLAVNSGKVDLTLTSDGKFLSLVTPGAQTGLAFDRSSLSGPLTVLEMDSTTGDLLVTATAGPNAGKSVNLTAGHWA
jgi:hypothetical protein